MNKFAASGKNSTEVINVKEKVNQLFKDKLVLVMLVLGLLTIVAAAGAVRIRRGSEKTEESPYLEIQDPERVIAEKEEADGKTPAAGSSNAEEKSEEPVKEAGAGNEAAEAKDGLDASGTAAEEADSLNAEANAQPEAGNGASQEALEEAGAAAKESLVLDFTETEKLAWPVSGNVILGYSMETTTYFPTLEQYKCNPANLIQSDVSTPVAAPADARVLEIGTNEEIGNFVRLDLGNEYTAVCGQLKEIPVVVNEYLHKGDVIGYIAEPTKYYTVEGNNLYFELLHGETPVDALDYLE